MTDSETRWAVRAQVEEDIRRAIREAIAATGLRETARAVGISTPGLVQFLDGATPRSPTLALLRAWYFAQLPHGIDPPPVLARAALDLLVEPLLLESARRVVLRRILAEIAGGHCRAGTRPPRWLDALTES